MSKSSTFNHGTFYGILLLTFSVSGASAAATLSQGEHDDPYFDALRIAEKKVKRTRPHGISANALSSAILQKMLGRNYRPGESWTVAAWHEDPPISRPFARPGAASVNGHAGIFRYTVKEVSQNGDATIEVKQIQAFGIPSVDGRIDSLTLQINGASEQLHKIYTDRSGRRVKVSPEGIHSGITLLELFPLDVPEISTAEEKTPGTLPALPPRLNAIHARAGAPLDPSRSVWFEQDDFFGRPIQILWQKGDPWPHYLKTPGGIAVLLGKAES